MTLSKIAISRKQVSLSHETESSLDIGGGGGGTGGREEYERREREGREGGDLRGREAGEKCETLIILIQQCVTKLLKSRNQNIFDLHLTSSQSLLRLLSKRANENLRLG